MKKVIDIKNLSKHYGSFKAVSAVDFSVRPGECFGLLGPNGAGKSSLMNVIYGKSVYDMPEDTRVRVFDLDPASNASAIKSVCGIVPQEDNLDQELDVVSNLKIYTGFYGMNRKTAGARIDELLDFMELGSRRKDLIKSLSGGMKRRLTIARALLHKPGLLILDEPTTGLDPQVRHLIWDRLKKLKEKGVSILLSTHYMEEAFQICDRILVIDHGKKITEGIPRELLKTHIEPYVLELSGFFNAGTQKVIEDSSFRTEKFHGMIYVYAHDKAPLEEVGLSLGAGDFYIRRSTLEDLFLKMTGRTLNAAQ